MSSLTAGLTLAVVNGEFSEVDRVAGLLDRLTAVMASKVGWSNTCVIVALRY